MKPAHKITVKQHADYSRGFDRGNMGNAYESTDFDSWYDQHGNMAANQTMYEGTLLGFFSTYELHEIGDELLRGEVAAYRAKWEGVKAEQPRDKWEDV